MSVNDNAQDTLNTVYECSVYEHTIKYTSERRKCYINQQTKVSCIYLPL